LLDETAGVKASEDAKRQRDLKKFGKKVQIEKLQERQKKKTEDMEKIKMLKRSKEICQKKKMKYARQTTNHEPSLQSERELKISPLKISISSLMAVLMINPTRSLSVDPANVRRKIRNMVSVARRDMPSPTQQSLLLMLVDLIPRRTRHHSRARLSDQAKPREQTTEIANRAILSLNNTHKNYIYQHIYALSLVLTYSKCLQ